MKTITINFLLNIVVWFRAMFLDYPFWRVEYKDGKKTYPLYHAEASGLADVFNGKLYIDYTRGKEFFKLCQ